MDGALACFVPDGSCSEFGGSAELFVGLYAYAPWGSIVAGAACTLLAYAIAKAFWPVPAQEPARPAEKA